MTSQNTYSAGITRKINRPNHLVATFTSSPSTNSSGANIVEPDILAIPGRVLESEEARDLNALTFTFLSKLKKEWSDRQTSGTDVPFDRLESHARKIAQSLRTGDDGRRGWSNTEFTVIKPGPFKHLRDIISDFQNLGTGDESPLHGALIFGTKPQTLPPSQRSFLSYLSANTPSIEPGSKMVTGSKILVNVPSPSARSTRDPDNELQARIQQGSILLDTYRSQLFDKGKVDLTSAQGSLSMGQFEGWKVYNVSQEDLDEIGSIVGDIDFTPHFSHKEKED
nr:uncharacterized protein CI109_001753 [Kwoniella shandongensis]KAA5529813.1 hypothetical protein CI109_001753 [Kwoniella shandongensis]